MIPGSNLLLDAFEAIDTVEVQYMRYGSRALNSVGQWVTTYDAPVPVQASVQAVNRQTYTMLGLDFQKRYITLFTPVDSIDLDRNVTGDRFILPDGQIYQIESESDWYSIDGGWQGGTGWVEIRCVQVPYA